MFHSHTSWSTTSMSHCRRHESSLTLLRCHFVHCSDVVTLWLTVILFSIHTHLRASDTSRFRLRQQLSHTVVDMKSALTLLHCHFVVTLRFTIIFVPFAHILNNSCACMCNISTFFTAVESGNTSSVTTTSIQESLNFTF